MANKQYKKADGRYYRQHPNTGEEYQCCEAIVYPAINSDESRMCYRAAAKGDRLCSYHRTRSRLTQSMYSYYITVNRKGTYKKCVIGRSFQNHDEAEAYLNMNWTLITQIPKFVSASIMRGEYIM